MVQWSLNASSSSLPSGLTKCNVISQLSPHAHPAYTTLDLYENHLVVWWYHQIPNGDQLSLGLFGPMITECFFVFSSLLLICIWKNISAVLWMLTPPGEKILIEAICNVYHFACINSDIITFHSHNNIIFKEIHSLKLWLWHIST